MEKQKRIVVYTAIFGKYDSLITPTVVSPECDYICFTDQPLTSSVWQIRTVVAPLSDSTRSARKYKILAHEYLTEYEFSIWIDGNIQFACDPEELVAEYLVSTDIAVIDHGQSKEMPLTSLKEHLDRLLWMESIGKHQDDPDLMRAQYEHYISLGFPDTGGLAWTLMLVRRHKSDALNRAMEAWWRELEQWSKRDQMSFNYVVWKEALPITYIPVDGAISKYMKRCNHYLSPTRKLYSYILGAVKRIRAVFSI